MQILVNGLNDLHVKLTHAYKKVDWNIGFRRCPEKMSSLGGPTFKKKKKKKKNRM